MRNVFLFITMSLDGFIAGPNNELDWMVGDPQDPGPTQDIVALINTADTSFMGYPTATGMIPYWSNAAKDPSKSRGEHDLAVAITRIHSIVISKKPEKIDFDNAELLVVRDDNALIQAVKTIKQKPGRAIGIPGGVRTAQTFARLGLIDEFHLMVQPVAIGDGKRLFTSKVNLDLVNAKTYKSGVMRVIYRPR